MKRLKIIDSIKDKLYCEVNERFTNVKKSDTLYTLLMMGFLIGVTLMLLGFIIISPLVLLGSIYNDSIVLIDYINNYKTISQRKLQIIESMKSHGEYLLNTTGTLNLRRLVGKQGNWDYFYGSMFSTKKEFIREFILKYNSNYDTFAGEYIQCAKNRRRSLGDIYLITKYYYPNCTIEDVIKELIHLLNTKKIAGSYCSTIHKYVFHNQSDAYIKESKTEYPNNIRWEEIVKVYE